MPDTFMKLRRLCVMVVHQGRQPQKIAHCFHTAAERCSALFSVPCTMRSTEHILLTCRRARRRQPVRAEAGQGSGR